MAGKREKPEDIVLKLRQVDVLQGQGKSLSQGCSANWRNNSDLLSVAQRTSHVRHWSKDNGECGMSRGRLKRLKVLETEDQRLKRVVADLSLDKMILPEAGRDEGCKANHPADGL